jgi:uncharacterized membrane protein YhhN
MRSKSALILGSLVALAVLLSIAGNLLAHPWLHFLFTPLATILILSLALSNWLSFHKTYAAWISLGLFFSLLGDIALLRPAQYFLLGLIAFLCAHIAYLSAFTRNARFPARFSIWLLYLAIAASLYFFLLPALPSALKLSVAAYAIVLTSMGGQAMGRYIVRGSSTARLAAIGALFFILSDGLLSIDRFRSPLPYASLLILVPYFLGQWLIALSSSDP